MTGLQQNPDINALPRGMRDAIAVPSPMLQSGAGNMGNPALSGLDGQYVPPNPMGDMGMQGYANGGEVQPQIPAMQEESAMGLRNIPPQLMQEINTLPPEEQQKVIAHLQQMQQEGSQPLNPELVMRNIQSIQQDHPEQAAKVKELFTSLITSGQTTPQEMNVLLQLATTALQNPHLWSQMRDYAIKQGLAEPDDIPEQYDGGLLFVYILGATLALQGFQAQGTEQVPTQPEPEPQNFAEGGYVAGYADGGLTGLDTGAVAPTRTGWGDIYTGKSYTPEKDSAFADYTKQMDSYKQQQKKLETEQGNLQAGASVFPSMEKDINDTVNRLNNGDYRILSNDAWNAFKNGAPQGYTYFTFEYGPHWWDSSTNRYYPETQYHMVPTGNLHYYPLDRTTGAQTIYLGGATPQSAISSQAYVDGLVNVYNRKAADYTNKVNDYNTRAQAYSDSVNAFNNTPWKTAGVARYEVPQLGAINYHTPQADRREIMSRQQAGLPVGAGTVTPNTNAAEGGKIFGPGTGTSDSIPIRVSAGEYVIPAHVVRAKGTEFFDKMLANYSKDGGKK